MFRQIQKKKINNYIFYEATYILFTLLGSCIDLEKAVKKTKITLFALSCKTSRRIVVFLVHCKTWNSTTQKASITVQCSQTWEAETVRIVSSLFYLPLLHCNKPLLTLLKTRYFMPLFPLIFLFPFLKTDLHQVFFRVNFVIGWCFHFLHQTSHS